MVPILFVDDGGLFLLSRLVFNSQCNSILVTTVVKSTEGTETAASTKTATACVVS